MSSGNIPALPTGGLIPNFRDIMRMRRRGHRIPEASETPVIPEYGADITPRPQKMKKSSPLVRAAHKGEILKAKVLIEAGADLEGLNSEDGCTPLICAVREGHTQMAKLLIDAGAKVEAVPRNSDCTPLLWAARRGHVDAVEVLLDAGANVHQTTGHKAVPFVFAAIHGHMAVMKRLLRAGADINAAQSCGSTALSFAVRNKRMEVVRFLINAGADVNTTNLSGMLALTWAAGEGDMETATLLIDAGGILQAEHTTLIYWTPLIRAAEYGQASMMLMLLQRGAKGGVKNRVGETAYTIAKSKGHTQSCLVYLHACACLGDYTTVSTLTPPRSAFSRPNTLAEDVEELQGQVRVKKLGRVYSQPVRSRGNVRAAMAGFRVSLMEKAAAGGER